MCQRLREELPEVEVVFYTGLDELGARRARRRGAGAQGIVSKGDGADRPAQGGAVRIARAVVHTSPAFAARAAAARLRGALAEAAHRAAAARAGPRAARDGRADGHRRGDGQVAPGRDPPQAGGADVRAGGGDRADQLAVRLPVVGGRVACGPHGRADRGHGRHGRGRRRRRARGSPSAASPQRLVVRDPARAPRAPGRGGPRGVRATAPATEMRAALEGADDAVPRPRRGVDRPRRAAPDRRSTPRSRRACGGSSTSRSSARRPTRRSRSSATTGRPRSTSARPACAFTFARMSLYLDFVPLMAGADGAIARPGRATGRVAVVIRATTSPTCVAAVLDRATGHDGATYDVTGPRGAHASARSRPRWRARVGQADHLQGRDARGGARLARRATARPTGRSRPGSARTRRSPAGEVDVVSDVVERLAGHPPQTLSEYLRAHPDALDHVVS